MGAAASRWRDALAEWAIPEEILSRAPVSPWHYPVSLFASRADEAARAELTPSNRRALEALPQGGAVLDVGCGAGAASLPLAPSASNLVGVDASTEMLAAFADRARAAGVEAEAVEGSWPDVAEATPPADVVVCHHVVYNAPDLPPFALVAMVRRLLCLPAERDQEVEAQLDDRIVERDGRWGFPDRTVATIWWQGSARG